MAAGTGSWAVLGADHNQICEPGVVIRVFLRRESGMTSWLEDRARFPLLHLCLVVSEDQCLAHVVSLLYPHGTTTTMEKFLEQKMTVSSA